jgi:hypothetical protein
MRYLVTVTIPVVLLLAFGLLVFYLNGKASGETELTWQRRVYLFGAVETIVFTVVGWIFGRKVNRRQVDAAENRANRSEQRADAAANHARFRLETGNVDTARRILQGRNARRQPQPSCVPSHRYAALSTG